MQSISKKIAPIAVASSSHLGDHAVKSYAHKQRLNSEPQWFRSLIPRCWNQSTYVTIRALQLQSKKHYDLFQNGQFSTSTSLYIASYLFQISSFLIIRMPGTKVRWPTKVLQITIKTFDSLEYVVDFIAKFIVKNTAVHLIIAKVIRSRIWKSFWSLRTWRHCLSSLDRAVEG